MWEAFDRPAPPAGARVHANAGAKESVTIHNVICVYDAVEVLGLPLATIDALWDPGKPRFRGFVPIG